MPALSGGADPDISVEPPKPLFPDTMDFYYPFGDLVLSPLIRTLSEPLNRPADRPVTEPT
jgi:hypothetical protein